jgi:hypothetical protein
VTQGGARIDELLDECRRTLDRVEPDSLGAALAAGALVVDIRPAEERRLHGELPGAVVIDRDVLEWRQIPTSPHRMAGADDPSRQFLLV